MGGKSKKVTTGYWYRVAMHLGISATPIDSLLEIRVANKTAWSGSLNQSGVININQPNLLGGEKDQGGLVGNLQLMNGEPSQQPNAYLAQVFGPQQPAWHGVATLAWLGGRYGANNPYPQPIQAKILVAKRGWDDDPGDGSACWYPEKVSVPVAASQSLPEDADGWDYQILPDEPNPGYDNLDIPSSGWITGARAPFGDGTGYNTKWPLGTVLWARRTVTIVGANQTLTALAENGCIIFINGSLAGGSNRSNAQIVAGDQVPFTFPVASGSTYEIVVKAFDEKGGNGPGGVTRLWLSISTPGLTGMNPAHIIYDALTSRDRGSEPTASIDDANFRAAADYWYAQGFGLCTAYNPDSETVQQFLDRIGKVAACSVSRDPTTGRWCIDIANGVYDLASLPVLADDDVLEFQETPMLIDDVPNSVAVEYEDVEQNLVLTTPPVQAIALINANGVSPQTVSYHELPTSGLATRVAQRELQNQITPRRSFALTTNRKLYASRPNTYFRLQLPRRGISDMVCLLPEKSSGTLPSGAMTLTATEDVYSLPASTFVQTESGIDTRPPRIPVPVEAQVAFEAPWTTVAAAFSSADLSALPDDAAFVLACAAAPGDYPDYVLTVSADGGATYTEVATEQWCPTAQVVEGDPLTGAPATSFTLAGGAGLDAVVVGSAALWGSEIVRVDALDATATPPTLTVGRGCADTVPAAHAADERIWFYDDHAAADPTQYAAGEMVLAKLLTESGSARLDASLATPVSVTLAGRAWLPYPPQNIKINNGAPPASATGTLALAWSRRNRTVQADQLLDYAAADVAPDDDVRYYVRAYDSGHTLLVGRDDLAGPAATVDLVYSGDLTIEIGAINDVGESVQHTTVALAYTAGSATANAITGDAWAPTSVIFVAGGA